MFEDDCMHIPVRVTHDVENDLAYVYIGDTNPPSGAAVRQETIGLNLVLDFDERDRLIGIEFLSLSVIKLPS